MTGHSGGPGRWTVLLIVAALCVPPLAETLPRLAVPVTVICAVVIVLRLVFFYTRRW